MDRLREWLGAGGVALWWVCALLLFSGSTRGLAQDAAGKLVPLVNVKAMNYPGENTEVRVTTEGVVVWKETTNGNFFYLQDKLLGIRVDVPKDREMPSVGDRVRVTGALHWGESEVGITDGRAEVIGHPGLPRAKRTSTASMAAGVAWGTRVHVRGVLKLVQPEGSRLRLVLDADGVRVPVIVMDAEGTEAEDYVGQYVYINGVAAPGSGPGLFEIMVASFEELYFRKRMQPDRTDIIPINELFHFRKGYSWGARVKIHGQILGIVGDQIHLNDGTAGIVVRGGNAPDLKEGEWIEAMGFPEFDEGRKILSDATVVKIEAAGTVEGAVVSAGELLTPLADQRYVIVTGKLVDFMSALPEGEGKTPPLVMVLNSDGTVFDVNIPAPDPDWKPEVGSLLRVKGICQNASHVGGMPESFSILTLSHDGVEVVKGPGFFTERRLLILLCGTLLVLALTGFGAFVVVKKNAGLQAEVRERSAITAERGRLAGDLHDTLEQMLTAIHLQLHSLGPVEALPEAAREGVSSSRDLVRQCHVEIRNFVWDLRPAALGKYDLSKALERMAASLVLGTATRVTLCREGEPREIPALVEDNLLRIGQEALTNAVKHGHPSEITIALETGGPSLVLEIRDDGEGVPENLAEGFGLRGMKERAKRIGGLLEISPQAGGGTIVRVEVPLA